MPLLNQLLCFHGLMPGPPSPCLCLDLLRDPCPDPSWVRRLRKFNWAKRSINLKLCIGSNFITICSNEWLLYALHFDPLPVLSLLLDLPHSHCLSSGSLCHGPASLLSVLWTHSRTYVCVLFFLFSLLFYWVLPILEVLLEFTFCMKPFTTSLNFFLLQDTVYACKSVNSVLSCTVHPSLLSSWMEASWRKEACVWYFFMPHWGLTQCWLHSRHLMNSHEWVKCNNQVCLICMGLCRLGMHNGRGIIEHQLCNTFYCHVGPFLLTAACCSHWCL